MKKFIRDHLIKSFGPVPSGSYDVVNLTVAAILEMIYTAEFARLYRDVQIPACEAETASQVLLTLKRSIEAMSKLTEEMLAAATALKTGRGGATPEEITASVHTVVDPIVTDLQTKIATITSSEADDATKIADITAALDTFTTTIAGPASTGTGDGTGTDTGAGTGTGTDTGGAAA